MAICCKVKGWGWFGSDGKGSFEVCNGFEEFEFQNGFGNEKYEILMKLKELNVFFENFEFVTVF